MEAFHYPPDLLALLVDTIPLLCRSKPALLLFFQGAGVDDRDLREHRDLLASEPDSFRKHPVARAVLTRLNERGDATIRERREVLKRVCEFEDFSTCWPNDQLRARGLVSQIRGVVNVKDSFTRMKQEREHELDERRAVQEREAAAKRKKRDELVGVRRDLSALFFVDNPWRRGKALEGILNRLFKAAGIAVREAFILKGSESEGIVEQIDGVVQVDAHYYLVEMKWHTEPLGVGDVSQSLVRAFAREGARALIVSASGFTDPAITTCRENVVHRANILCELREILVLLEQERDLGAFFKAKIDAAVADKNPFFRPLG